MNSLPEILLPKLVLGVSLIIKEGQIHRTSCCLLKQESDGLHIREHKYDISLEEINIKKDIPIVINVSGQGVITKAIPDSSKSNADLMDVAFPGLDKSEFYAQSAKDSFCTIIRRELLDNLLVELNAGINVIGVVLDHFSVLEARDVIEEKELISLSNLQFQFQGEKLNSLTPADSAHSFEVDGVVLKGDEFSAFSTAYQVFVNEQSIWIDGFNLEGMEEFVQRNIFNKLKIAAPVLLILILIINFLAFLNASSVNEELSFSLLKNESTLSELDNLKKEVQIKESYLNSESWFNNSKNSFYLDRLASTVPDGISLSFLNVSPINEVESSGSLAFVKNEIIVEGIGKRTIDVNSWVQQLDSEEWVVDHELLGLNQEKNEDEVVFEILIQTN